MPGLVGGLKAPVQQGVSMRQTFRAQPNHRAQRQVSANVSDQSIMKEIIEKERVIVLERSLPEDFKKWVLAIDSWPKYTRTTGEKWSQKYMNITGYMIDEGEAIVNPVEGGPFAKKLECKAGDYVSIPEGLTCEWTVTKMLKYRSMVSDVEAPAIDEYVAKEVEEKIPKLQQP